MDETGAASDLPTGTRIKHADATIWRTEQQTRKPWKSTSGSEYTHDEIDALIASGAKVLPPRRPGSRGEDAKEKAIRMRREIRELREENRRLHETLSVALASNLLPNARERLARYLYLESVSVGQREVAARIWDRRDTRLMHINREPWLAKADELLAVVTGKEE